ncbi:hypothetical protein DQ04_02981100 [Trypanosoma grayi]|uniref:hypothetical protein n=1 Tax=Trypanosoma grayi TaxID=71804 RepID=UPI0004F42ECF|nr:hypothetical protein DQ04_02981100 [Trypanosoma grayi]KEG11105.1 hypothetical protein DQ04_02981100 [Trypanosoma grayi]
MNAVITSLRTVKQAAEGAEATVEEAHKKAAISKNDAEEVLKAATAAKAAAEELKEAVAAGVQHGKDTEVKKKARVAVTTSRTAKERLRILSESSNSVEVAATAAVVSVMSVINEVKNVGKLSDSLLSVKVNTVSKHAETTQAALSGVKNSAKSSCTESTAAHESAMKAESHAKQAEEHSAMVEGIGGESAGVMHSGLNKERAEMFALAVAESAGKALEEANAAAREATTAFANAQKALGAAREMTKAATDAEEAAEEALKQKSNDLSRSRSVEKRPLASPQENGRLNGVPGKAALTHVHGTGAAVDVQPNGGHDAAEHQHLPEGPRRDASSRGPAAAPGDGRGPRQSTAEVISEMKRGEANSHHPSVMSPALGVPETQHKEPSREEELKDQPKDNHAVVESKDTDRKELHPREEQYSTSVVSGTAEVHSEEKGNTNESPRTDAESTDSTEAGEAHSASATASAIDAMNVASNTAPTGEGTTGTNEGADEKDTSPAESLSSVATTAPTLALSGISSDVNTNQGADGDGRSACVGVLSLLLLLSMVFCVAVE